MGTIPSGLPPCEDPTRRLEQALIEGFLNDGGYGGDRLAALPPDERRRVLEESSRYAAGRLTEIEARAHYVHDLHRK